MKKKLINKFLLLALSSLVYSSFSIASESNVYDFEWLDQDKKIYVLQNRQYRKNQHLYVGFNVGQTLSGAFIDSNNAQGRVGFFFHEDWGIELLYSANSGKENDAAKGVLEQGTTPYYRKINNYVGGMLVWSPFYGKLNTFNRIVYTDWSFGLGAAQIQDSNNKNRFITSTNNTLTNETHTGAMWSTGLRFYINQSWAVRLDLTALHYQANRSRQTTNVGSTFETKSWFHHYDLGVGLNYTF